jgi:hypothetical protein
LLEIGADLRHPIAKYDNPVILCLACERGNSNGFVS